MDKAYSVKALVASFKEAGIEIGEDAAIKAVEILIKFFEDSAKLSENKFDDIVAGLLPTLKPYIMEQLDRIDGKKG